MTKWTEFCAQYYKDHKADFASYKAMLQSKKLREEYNKAHGKSAVVEAVPAPVKKSRKPRKPAPGQS
jgi:hypothetical protein